MMRKWAVLGVVAAGVGAQAQAAGNPVPVYHCEVTYTEWAKVEQPDETEEVEEFTQTQTYELPVECLPDDEGDDSCFLRWHNGDEIGIGYVRVVFDSKTVENESYELRMDARLFHQGENALRVGFAYYDYISERPVGHESFVRLSEKSPGFEVGFEPIYERSGQKYMPGMRDKKSHRIGMSCKLK